jgi:hypothetical protein
MVIDRMVRVSTFEDRIWDDASVQSDGASIKVTYAPYNFRKKKTSLRRIYFPSYWKQAGSANFHSLEGSPCGLFLTF